jgi:hypothetical protein
MLHPEDMTDYICAELFSKDIPEPDPPEPDPPIDTRKVFDIHIGTGEPIVTKAAAKIFITRVRENILSEGITKEIDVHIEGPCYVYTSCILSRKKHYHAKWIVIW